MLIAQRRVWPRVAQSDVLWLPRGQPVGVVFVGATVSANAKTSDVTIIPQLVIRDFT